MLINVEYCDVICLIEKRNNISLIFSDGLIKIFKAPAVKVTRREPHYLSTRNVVPNKAYLLPH